MRTGDRIGDRTGDRIGDSGHHDKTAWLWCRGRVRILLAESKNIKSDW